MSEFPAKTAGSEDEDGNRITFRGSMNESETAMIENFETIEVDCSWEATGFKRAVQREQQFDSIWNAGGNKWKTKSIPQAVIDKLIQIKRPLKGAEYDTVNDGEGLFVKEEEAKYVVTIPTPRIPEWLEERKYQKKAVKSWLVNKNRGIFQMATGTGKTKTSLMAVTKVLDVYYKNNMKCGLIIVVPYVVLLEQWLEDLDDFSIKAIPCYESKNKWLGRLENSIDLFNQNARDKLFAITTNKTFQSMDFQRCINRIDGDYIFLADEMHHLTSDTMLECLPNNATYRLGLSATLMSKFNSDKMERLKAYFNGIIYEYTMKEAIDNGKLTKYYYYPIYVELTDDEKEDYYSVSRKISKAIAMAEGNLDDEDNVSLQALLSQRARILASAQNKLTKLKELASGFTEKNNLIVYCGDKIEADGKYIDKVYDVVNNELGIISAKFTAAENRNQRKDILDLFKSGMIQALIAIRCLDEGVDIPQLETAIIMSSGTNPKEFIQRRGRILRNAPGKDFAYIYDFIVMLFCNAPDFSAVTCIVHRCIGRKIAEDFGVAAGCGMAVSGSFYFRYHFYVPLGCILYYVLYLLLSIISSIAFVARPEGGRNNFIRSSPRSLFRKQGKRFDFYSPALIVRKMPVEFVQFVISHPVQNLVNILGRPPGSGNIQLKTSVSKIRMVFYASGRNFKRFYKVLVFKVICGCRKELKQCLYSAENA